MTAFVQVCALLRIPLTVLGIVGLVLGPFTGFPFSLGLAMMLIGLAMYLRLGIVNMAPIAVGAPLRGTWVAVNTPAVNVPSHGAAAYGQSHAVDLLLHDPDKPLVGITKGWGLPAPEESPSFGQPVFAPISGEVLVAYGKRPDHKSRSTTAGFALMTLESMLRELGGPKFIVGNHVIIRDDSGTCAVLAHLQRGSLQVKVGDVVKAGQPIARVGNSGNTSEPHLHFQLTDTPRLRFAAGLPFAFPFVEEGEEVEGYPPDQKAITFR